MRVGFRFTTIRVTITRGIIRVRDRVRGTVRVTEPQNPAWPVLWGGGTVRVTEPQNPAWPVLCVGGYG